MCRTIGATPAREKRVEVAHPGANHGRAEALGGGAVTTGDGDERQHDRTAPGGRHRPGPAYARVVEPDVEEIEADGTLWRFDRAFLTSRWACIWGRGCLGILPAPAPHLGHGCCSIGADLDGEDEARMIAALAATLGPEEFEHHAAAREGGIFGDAERAGTRVVAMARASS